MAQEKEKKVKATTPKGSVRWFKFNKPDPKFKKYSCDLVLEDTPELRKLIDLQDEIIEKRFQDELAKAAPAKKKLVEKSKFKPIEEELDSNGEATGRFVIKFRGASEGTNKDKEVYPIPGPTIFNAKAQPITGKDKESLRVNNGTIAQIAFEISSYYTASLGAGVSFKPKAVILHVLAEANSDASQFGFSASELAEENDDDHSFEQENSQAGSDDKDQDF